MNSSKYEFIMKLHLNEHLWNWSCGVAQFTLSQVIMFIQRSMGGGLFACNVGAKRNTGVAIF